MQESSHTVLTSVLTSMLPAVPIAHMQVDDVAAMSEATRLGAALAELRGQGVPHSLEQREARYAIEGLLAEVDHKRQQAHMHHQ